MANVIRTVWGAPSPISIELFNSKRIFPEPARATEISAFTEEPCMPIIYFFVPREKYNPKPGPDKIAISLALAQTSDLHLLFNFAVCHARFKRNKIQIPTAQTPKIRGRIRARGNLEHKRSREHSRMTFLRCKLIHALPVSI